VLDQLNAWRDAALATLREARDEKAVEQVSWMFLGRNGHVTGVLRSVGKLAPEDRAAAGAAANRVKRELEAAVEQRLRELAQGRLAEIGNTDAIDVTFPASPLPLGRLHVLTQVRREIETILEGIGYHVELGPEVETDWYNFEALNLPQGHASRDVQDTFFLNESEDLLLRTHTSPVQIRAMERLKEPPIYVIVPGRTYRRDATDATHLTSFMQLEALAIDEGLSVGDLKGTILYFAQSLWGADRRVRIRPHHFPYTEPSFEFDLSCGVCGGTGCRSCGQDGWLEVGGCGMVHPNVLRNGGIDPQRYSGFAWGFGIERMAMLKYDIEDLRLFYDNDTRFLEQF